MSKQGFYPILVFKSSLKRFIFLAISFIFLLTACDSSGKEETIMTVKKWDTLILDFEGPEVSETDEYNPFLNYSLVVTFSNDGSSYNIPGYFAADGNAAESSAESGNIWRVKFAPDQLGEWNYKVSFKKGDDIVIAADQSRGAVVEGDGIEGRFEVVTGDFDAKDFRAQGRLRVLEDVPYQQFSETKKYFIKGGADSPENMLGYKDFDGTYDIDKENKFLHAFEAHVKDWKEGDPTWKDGKGKGLIGGLNYLASKGVNAIYFLSMNIEGDGKDVWMYHDHKDFTRFDCSKLDQWDIVFTHAQRNGILLHFVTQETENELLLDGGDVGNNRKLYYRELIARFAHHPAVTWNMGEENGVADFTPKGQNNAQRKAMFQYFKENDPYQNLVVLHTHAAAQYKDSILLTLLDDENLDGLSVQVDQPVMVFDQINKWKKLSKDAGRNWIFNMDEIGPHWQGVLPDSYDIKHDTTRREVLWGSLMAGAAGVEWYFGGNFPHMDLNSEDWRQRNSMWEQTKYALDFFQNYIPFWEMKTDLEAIDRDKGYCFAKEGEIYVVYLPFGDENTSLNVEELEGEKVSITWYNPREGGKLMEQKEMMAGESIALGAPPTNGGMDWVVLLKIL